jgi:glycosyltransferase involved in cell wall biosynthesis
MHVVIVSDYAEVNGGASRVSIVSARALAERGVRVTYFCGTGSVAGELDHPMITVRHLGLLDVWNSPGRLQAAASSIWNDPARRALQSLLKEAGPETIVHIHQWSRCLSPSIFAALGAHHWAVSLHDYFFVCPTGLLYVAPRQQTCSLRPMSAACILCNCGTRSRVHKAVRVARHGAMNAALSRPERSGIFIHVSDFAARAARAHLPPGSSHFVVPNPCGTAGGEAVDVRRNKTFVYVGRLQREKGVLDFARASREAGVPALFLGDGPEAQRIRMLNPSAEIRPWGTDGAVEAALKEARCIVLPSRWSETFGLTVLEAQAHGVPAIVARNSGAAEAVERARGGLVVEGGNVDQLADAVRTVAHDDDLASDCGRRARLSYSSGYWSPTCYGERLTACYEAILSDATSRHLETPATPGGPAPAAPPSAAVPPE